MPTVINDAATLYQRLAAILEKHAAPAALKADVDALFHSPEEPKASTERDARLPADAPVNAVVFDTTGKTLSDFQDFRGEVGLATPIYDQNGHALDVRMQPILPPSGGDAPNNTDFFKGDVWARLAAVDSVVTLSGNCPTPGTYYVEVGEQFDQLFTVEQNGAAVGSYPDVLIPARGFQLSPGPCSIVARLNEKALTPEIIAEREAQGQGLSAAHYHVRPVPAAPKTPVLPSGHPLG